MEIRGHRIFMWLVLQMIIIVTITIIIITITITIIITIALQSLILRSFMLHPFLLLLYKTLHILFPLLPLMLEVSIILLNSMLSCRIVLKNPFPLSAFKKLNSLIAMPKLSSKTIMLLCKIPFCIAHIGVSTIPMLQEVFALCL